MLSFIRGWWKHRRPHPIREARWAAQRVTRGFSDRDWWSFDTFLAGVIADACHKFRYDGHGWPGDYEMTLDEWHESLKKIEDGFRAYTKIFEIIDIEEEKRVIAEMQEAGELLIKLFPAFWD